jgi:hypothetical protein
MVAIVLLLTGAKLDDHSAGAGWGGGEKDDYQEEGD